MNGGPVIDLSHFNIHPDFQMAKSDGILAVIHKATQGTSFSDLACASRREQVFNTGLLWGAYHFGTGAGGVEQADFFLQKVQHSDLLILDFEINPQGPSMTLDQARDFVTHIRSVTGRWPGLYGGDYLKQLLGTAQNPVLGNCWLWLAQYGPAAVVPANWKSWILWQYTDRGDPVAGIGPCDRSRFNGDAAALLQFWRSS